MITIDKHPKNIDFAGNGLPFRIISSFYKTQIATKASVEFSKSGTLAAGESFVVYDPSADGAYVITAVSGTPDDDGFEISAGKTAVKTAAELRSIWMVNKYYNVTVESDVIRFEMREAGYNELSAHCMFDGSSYTANVISDGQNSIYNEYYKTLSAYFEVDNSKNYYSLDLNEDAEAEWMPGDALKPYLFPALPDFSLSNIVSDDIKKVAFGFAEHYDNPSLSLHRNVKSESYYILPGKINYVDFPSFDFANKIKSENKQPVEQLKVATWKDAKHYLHYIFTRDNQIDVNVDVRLYYNDRTMSTFSAGAILSPSNYDRYLIPSGYNQLDIDNNKTAGKTVYRYDIEIKERSHEQLIAERMKYYVHKKSEFAKQYLFINQYGCWEVLNCEGRISVKTESKRESYKVSKKIEYSADDWQYAAKITNKRKIIATSTGAKPVTDKIAIMHALQSDKIYEITDEGFERIIIDDESIDIVNESELLINVEFAYKFAYEL